MSGPLELLEWLPETGSSAEAVDSRMPPTPDTAVLPYVVVTAAAAAVILLSFYVFGPRDVRERWAAILILLRRRAALVICLGLGLIAVDWLLLGDLLRDQYWRRLHRDHWIAAAGTFVALVGLYHWLAQAGDS